MYRVPAAVASVPINGQCRTSDLDTNRQWRAACITTMSSHEMWLATSSTGPVTGAVPRIDRPMPQTASMRCAQACTAASRWLSGRRGNRAKTTQRPDRMCKSARNTRPAARNRFMWRRVCQSGADSWATCPATSVQRTRPGSA